ncbi:MAG: hypothetical protein M5R36_19815 [Deltaproteobacteria bacterium]|nr:hypothetical protein [Deltaproteobacteria bacterium]
MSATGARALSPFAQNDRPASRPALLILAAIVLFHVAMGAAWVAHDRQLAGNDETDHLQNGLRHRFRLIHQDHTVGAYAERLLGFQHVTTTPPLLFDIWEAVWLVTGPSPAAARAVTIAWMAIGGLACFGAARRLNGDIAGLIAAACFFAYPSIVYFSTIASTFVPTLRPSPSSSTPSSPPISAAAPGRECFSAC